MRQLLGQLLVSGGQVSAADVDAALAQQKAGAKGRRLGELLVAAGKVAPEAVARALATQYELPFVQLPEIPSSVSALLPVEFQAQHRLVPFKLEVEGRRECIHLAIADPTQIDVVEELRFQISKPLKLYVAAWDDVDSMLAALMGGEASVVIDDEEEEPAPPPKVTAPVAPPPAVAPKAPEPEGDISVEIPDEWASAPITTPVAAQGGQPPSNGASARAEPPTLRIPTPVPVAPSVIVAPDPTDNSMDVDISADPTPPTGIPVVALPQISKPPAAAAAVSQALANGGSWGAMVSEPPRISAPVTTPIDVPKVSVPLPAFEPPKPAPPIAKPPEAPKVVAPPPPPPPAPRPPLTTPVETPRVALPPPPPPPRPPLTTPVETPAVAMPPPEQSLELSESDLKVLESLEQLATGGEASLESSKVKPPQMVASLIRLLIKKGVIDELEFLEELGRK